MRRDLAILEQLDPPLLDGWTVWSQIPEPLSRGSALEPIRGGVLDLHLVAEDVLACDRGNDNDDVLIPVVTCTVVVGRIARRSADDFVQSLGNEPCPSG